MIVQCERCGIALDTDVDRYRLVSVDAGLFQITCTSHTATQDSGEKTSSEAAVPASRSKEAKHGQ